MTTIAETNSIQEFLDKVEIPDDLEDRLRASVYRSPSDMPKEERRAQKISFFMAMKPKGIGWTREDFGEKSDCERGNVFPLAEFFVLVGRHSAISICLRSICLRVIGMLTLWAASSEFIQIIPASRFKIRLSIAHI